MSIKCSFCDYKMTTFEFIGHMSAEVFLILKEKILTRGISDSWDRFMLAFSNKLAIPCPVCKKFESWLPDVEQTYSLTNVKMNVRERRHAK